MEEDNDKIGTALDEGEELVEEATVVVVVVVVLEEVFVSDELLVELFAGKS